VIEAGPTPIAATAPTGGRVATRESGWMLTGLAGLIGVGLLVLAGRRREEDAA
jgi:hypothetical protein